MAIKTPTIDSFIETLGKMGKNKFCLDGDNIRYVGFPVEKNRDVSACIPICPIEYLAARSNHKKADNYTCQVSLAASLLGLNPTDRRQIVIAADKSPGYSKSLRKRMLAVVGL